MMANPAVEPSARCALRMPDAMPARSAGTDAIATLVATGSTNARARPISSSPTTTSTSGPPTPAMMIARPTTAAASPPSVGRRSPTPPSEVPGDRGEHDQGHGLGQEDQPSLLCAVAPHVLQVLRKDQQQPVHREQHDEDGDDSDGVHVIPEQAHVHHRL